MKLRIAFVFHLIIPLIACNISDKNAKDHTTIDLSADSTTAPKKVRDIEPSLWKADSLQILYYDNPDGDSLRYSRFFSFTETNDSLHVNNFLNELDQVFVQQNSPRNCRSEGKLFLLNRQDVLKTIYFSTRSDSCSYLYFIKDGSFIYLRLSAKANEFLRENKKKAVKP